MNKKAAMLLTMTLANTLFLNAQPVKFFLAYGDKRWPIDRKSLFTKGVFTQEDWEKIDKLDADEWLKKVVEKLKETDDISLPEDFIIIDYEVEKKYYDEKTNRFAVDIEKVLTKYGKQAIENKLGRKINAVGLLTITKGGVV